MTQYIERRESIHYWLGEDDHSILNVMANRYIGANPAIPFSYRVFSEDGIMQTEEGLYDINLAEKLPEAQAGRYAYAFGLVWSDDERSMDTMMMPFGPVRLYVNEEMLYRSTAAEELQPNAKVIVPVVLRKGWNALLIEAVKTPAGFGCRFGAIEAKVRIMNVLSPFESRIGAAGWVYSIDVPSRMYDSVLGLPDYRQREEVSGIRWMPERDWQEVELQKGNCERIFGTPEQTSAAYSWTKISTEQAEDSKTVWSGKVLGATMIWLDGRIVLELAEAGDFRQELSQIIPRGNVLVRTESSEQGWGFELEVHSSTGKKILFELPIPIQGAAGDSQTWLHLGPLAADVELEPSQVQTMKQVFDSGFKSISADHHQAKVYWSLDGPNQIIRPYYENAMLSNKWTTGAMTNFGRWDYPLGVTMYGLLRTSRALKRDDMASYAASHIRSCAEMYEYALWDKEQYGFPSINHQLVLMKMLDNCGSFGSAMLEAYLNEAENDEHLLRIADEIANFMTNRLERREDGAFYRLCEGEYSADTMWADDLYMSTPFLGRYYKATGDSSYIDDAARQFLLYRSYLFIPEHGVMSHVYDFKYGQATRIPWGRGNGWCLFSLSELLEILPADHTARPELLALFRELCAGILVLQGDSGLWHQVITRPDAYEEASCTAMFAYAFARGVRFGWLENRDVYQVAALRAWRGLTGKAIDRQGNVHGVCSGSRYSFTSDYYSNDLLTVVNDNHGIGIMLLAGVEIDCMKKELKEQKPAIEVNDHVYQ
ncbi:MAG: glycoside hydrolase family 105 protein [Candidatus Pristimantibacillus sp.]